MDVSGFRAAFPEFGDVTRFPDARISFWVGIGQKTLVVDRWGDLLDYGLGLFVAHNLALQTQAVASSSKGGTPGAASGVVSSKSVDKVSVSYDTGSSTVDGAGAWNLTTYGAQFIQLSRMIGVGAVQL
ncbi:DUF4054 domain-containing protein [Pseudochelatococcus contaminans]|nr:DUF4054 domain-containing protein [Pseudochelatococcus contaminans]